MLIPATRCVAVTQNATLLTPAHLCRSQAVAPAHGHLWSSLTAARPHLTHVPSTPGFGRRLGEAGGGDMGADVSPWGQRVCVVARTMTVALPRERACPRATRGPPGRAPREQVLQVRLVLLIALGSPWQVGLTNAP